jgi:hypothetical protein
MKGDARLKEMRWEYVLFLIRLDSLYPRFSWSPLCWMSFGRLEQANEDWLPLF